jgi:putative ribosome biogenesis GTPase RsgA
MPSHSEVAQPSRVDFEARQSMQLVPADTSGLYATLQSEAEKHSTRNPTLTQTEGIQPQREISVLVLGETGAGKSSLLKQATGSTVKIGHSLKYCKIMT